jgi:hypothetical protein
MLRRLTPIPARALVLHATLLVSRTLAGHNSHSPPHPPHPPHRPTRTLNNIMYTLPSTLTSTPTAALVPPGQCQFGSEPTAVRLLERTRVSPTSYVLRFGPLPASDEPLNLSTCACLLARADIAGAGVTTRPYTPISTNQQIGSFDLLVKNYEDMVCVVSSAMTLNMLELNNVLPFSFVRSFARSCISHLMREQNKSKITKFYHTGHHVSIFVRNVDGGK